jgi:hypothetical protein
MSDVFLLRAVFFLCGVLKSFVDKGMEIERSARVAVCLLRVGVCAENQLFYRLKEEIIRRQLKDGGWRNVEETVWCMEVLKILRYKENSFTIERARSWLNKQKSHTGGWGQSIRDFPRIPLTSWIMLLHFELLNWKDIDWLIDSVEEDISNGSSFFLTYKLSLPVVAFRKRSVCLQNEDEWLGILALQQNDDGGFSPWKNHPIGSEIVSSAYALCAFYKQKKYESVFNACLQWILKNQLSNGSWPYHYIEYGACMGVFALSEIRNGK